MDYVTFKIPFSADGDVANDLLTTARLFRAAAQNVLVLAKHQRELPMGMVGWSNAFRGAAYEVIPNRRYADGAVALVMGIYTACKTLDIDFKSVELSDWLMFQQGVFEKSFTSNIVLKHDYTFHVITVSNEGGKRHIITPTPDAVSRYKDLLSAVLNNDAKYIGRVVINEHAGSRVNGEVEVIVTLDFYNHVFAEEPGGEKLVGGVSVSASGIDLVIIRKNNKIVHRKFALGDTHATSEVVRGLLNYAHNYGVGLLLMENPTIYAALRWVKPRGGDTEKLGALVLKALIIEELILEARRFGIKIAYVDPRITMNNELVRKSLQELTRRHEGDEPVDENAAIAYLMAMRGLKVLTKSSVTTTTK